MTTNEFSELLKKADQGDAEAQVAIGRKYNTGKDVELNNALAFSYFKKAADKEDPEGQFCLGMSYWCGLGVKRDLGKAKEYLQKAADKGHAKAAEQLRELQIFLLKFMAEKISESQEEIHQQMDDFKSDAVELLQMLKDIQKKLDEAPKA